MTYKIIKDGGEGKKRGWRVCRGSEHLASFNTREIAREYIRLMQDVDALAERFFMMPPTKPVPQK